MLSSLASMPSQVVARSGEQLRGSLPISTKREVDEVDWEESEEKDVLARLPLDQLLKEMRMALPTEAEAAPALKLLDKNRRSMSPDELTTSSVLVHVYNLNEAFVKANRVLSIAGSGAFHAGVEIFGWEWSYGVRGVKKTIPRVQTRHIYKFQELEALAALQGVTREELYVEEAPTALNASPSVRVRLRQEDVQKICERSVLVKAVLEVWALGSSCSEAVRSATEQGADVRRQRRKFLAPPMKLQLRVEAFGRTLNMEDKAEIMEEIRPLFDGDEVVDLKSPETTLWVLEEHRHESDEKTHLGPRKSRPQRVIIGRQVAGGRSMDKKLKGGEKCYFHRYDLSKRAVLGPTTLENELAFIMVNCARVESGQYGMDPFCGTGGLLLAMTHFGAKLFGGEIDIRVVRGWRIAYTKNKAAVLEAAEKRGLQSTGSSTAKACKQEPPDTNSYHLNYLLNIGLPVQGVKKAKQLNPNARAEKDHALANAGGCNIFTNFVQYDLPSPEIVVCDNAMPCWRQPAGGWLDFIVTDPPYGVRAGAKKQGREGKEVVVKDVNSYIPSKVSYGEDELSQDLLNFAAESLRDGGRLVFLVPVDLADFLGIDRAAVEQGTENSRPNMHDICHPKAGRKKDPRLCISETTRDPLLLDEMRYIDFIPQHTDLKLIGASLQVLSGGLGRLLVVMQRRPRDFA